jgi:hypothetical protein
VAANNYRALYSANHFKQEFREAAKVVAKNNITVVSNTEFFDHYLNRFTDPRHQSIFIYDWVEKFPALQSLLAGQHIAEFYYLEAPMIPGANNMITAEDTILIQNYTPLCRTRFARTQVFKFSIAGNMPKPALPDLLDLPDCRM